MRRESQRNFHTCQAVWGEFDFFCRKFLTKPPKFVQQLSKTKSYKVLNDRGKELQNWAEKEHSYKPLFHQIFKTSKQREHAIQRVLRKYYKLKTYSKPLHLILTSNFPYILNINQSTASGVETVQMKGRAKSLPVIRRKSRRKKVWFVAYVRNPTQCSRVNLGS